MELLKLFILNRYCYLNNFFYKKGYSRLKVKKMVKRGSTNLCLAVFLILGSDLFLIQALPYPGLWKPRR